MEVIVDATADDVWESLNTQSRVCLKSTHHSMAYDFTRDGELTKLGEAFAEWVADQFPDADYDTMLTWLELHTDELHDNLPQDGSKGQSVSYNRNRYKVLKAAQALRTGEVEQDAEHDQGD